MNGSDSGGLLLRVERGRPDETELAVVTAVLLARSAAQAAAGGPGGPRVGSSRWFGAAKPFRAARSWQ